MPPPRGTPNPIEGPGDYTVTKTVHNDTYPAINPTNFDFDGKTIFISGGSRGLGLAMTLAFAKAGASSIAVGARSSLEHIDAQVQAAVKAANRPSPKVLTLKFDVTNREDVDNAAAQVEKTFGKCDIVVNNAGILTRGKIAESDPDEWWKTMDVNLKGPYLVTRAFLPLLLKDGDRTICNVSSVGAHVTTPTVSAYQVSKLALVRLTEFINAEYADQGIIAFSIHPGNIPTDIVGGPDGVRAEMKFLFTESPEISADTITYLTSERREWLGGRYINVTWDMPELVAKKDAIIAGNRLKPKLDVDF